MKKLQYTITANASKQKVWNTMIELETFKVWTSEFTAGSYFDGSWNKGDRIKFMSPDGDGMSSVIADNKPYEYISIQHVGCIRDGIEDTDSPEAKSWTAAHENYTFSEKDGVTQLTVEMDVAPEYEDFMNSAWPRALAKLKEVCETV
jgi:hypothetical protein